LESEKFTDMSRALKIADPAFLARAGSAAFTPPSSANLKLWLKPESLSALSNNDPVGTWPDSSGNSADVTQTTVGLKPLYKTNQLNGVAGVAFDGIDDNLFNSNAPQASTVYTMFMVLKFTSATGTEVPFRIGENAGYGMYKGTGNRTVLHRLVADCVDAAATTNAEYWSAVRTSAPLLSFFVNGASQSVTNSTSNATAPESATHVGRFGGAGLYFAGTLFEILCYNTNLGTTDRQTVEAYLAAKYAL
jgi:hypothetical protein